MSVEKRLHLDAMLAPSTTDLRINRINLVNEVKVHGGKVISSKIAGLRPRRKPAWPEDELRVGRHGRQLMKAVEELNLIKSQRSGALDSFEGEHGLAIREVTVGFEMDESDWLDSSRSSPAPGRKRRHFSGAFQEVAGAKTPHPTTPFGAQIEHTLQNAQRDMEVADLMADPKVLAVFEAFREDEESGMPRKRVFRALQAISSSVHSATDELRGVVEDLMRTLKLGGHDDQMLTLQTFCLVIHAVHEIRNAYLHDRFNQLDSDASGKISVSEFRRLAWDMGFTLSSSELRELFEECDMDGSGGLDEDEFQKTAVTMVESYGFTQRQVKGFEELFDRYDQDASGRLSAEELASALGWFGTPTDIPTAEEIIKACDEDSDGHLTRSEFLRVMRVRLEQEMGRIRTQFAECDDDLSGKLDFVEVGNLVFQTGYRLSSREALQDCIDKAQQRSTSRSQDGSLFFEDVIELFGLLRECEGFSDQELKEYNAVFEQFDGGHTGHMREFELTRAIHWLGFPVTPQTLRELWCIADMDRTGTLERSEFLKIMRLISEKEVEEAQKFVLSHDTRASFTEAAVADLLATLGYVMPHSLILEAMATEVPGNKAGDLQSVTRIIRKVREAQVQKRRECHGVLDHIASKVRARFGRRIKLGKAIASSELEKLLLEIYPAAKHSPREMETLGNICEEGKTQPDGMSLDGAYKVINRFNTSRDEELWRREQAIADAAGFTASRLAMLRGIFVSADTNHHGYLNSDEVIALLDPEHFTEISAQGMDSMRDTISKLGSRQQCIEFVTFLEILAIGYGPRQGSKHAPRQAKEYLKTSVNHLTNRFCMGAEEDNRKASARVASLLLPLKQPPRMKDLDDQSEPTREERLTVGPDSFGLTKREWTAAKQLWCDPWPVGARLMKVMCELRRCERDEIPLELAQDAADAISRGNFTFQEFAAWLLKNADDEHLEARLRPLKDRGRRGFDMHMLVGDWAKRGAP